MDNNSALPKVSVVMSTYNGMRYLREQLESVCLQLSKNDELVISDDGSTDNTLDIVHEYMNKYDIIKLVRGPGKGTSYNFENGIINSKNEIILLSDQDDIWDISKIKHIKELFADNPEVDMILHDCTFCDAIGHESPGSNFQERNTKHGVWKNWIKSSYNGCCMSFRRSFIKKALPLKHPDVLYDQFFGMIAERENKSLFINDKLISHRIHENNVTKKQSIYGMIYYRYRLAKRFIEYLMKDKRTKKEYYAGH